MRLGVHLPVADFGDGLPTAAALRDRCSSAVMPSGATASSSGIGSG